MERESLLLVLIVLLGGLSTQLSWAWPCRPHGGATATQRERAGWARLWLPLLPALLIAAGLVGWALQEPDPVPEHVSRLVLVACLPFALIVARALGRAAWSLLREPGEYGIATVGFIRPQVLFSPFLAQRMDEPVIRAALAHERMHVLHRDPLRMWLGQLAADLQWPAPSARKRFAIWLGALEHARDEQARRSGATGEDLATAVLACTRFHRAHQHCISPCTAQLIGEADTLRERIARLLQPLSQADDAPRRELAPFLVTAVLAAVVFGVAFGEPLVSRLLGIGL